MTNFDLSSYIRWLKPGGKAADEQQQASMAPRSALLPLPPDYIMGEDSKPSIFPSTTPYAAEFLGSKWKQDIFERKPSINPGMNNSPSAPSPTALGLLLRSSVFRELVEKNASVPEDDTDVEDVKNQTQLGSDEDGYAEIFCDSMGDIPYKNGVQLQEQELQFLL